MNITIKIEVGDKTGKWGSLENVGDASIEFDWPNEQPVPSLAEIVQGLTAQAVMNHNAEKSKVEEGE